MSKKVLLALLPFFLASCIRQKVEEVTYPKQGATSVDKSMVKVPYDSTYQTSHDSNYIAKELQTTPTTHDTVVTIQSINTISVTHDTLVKRRRRWRTISTTHDSSYVVNSSQVQSITHDTSYLADVLKTIIATHDTTSTFYRDSIISDTKFGASGDVGANGLALLGVKVTRVQCILKDFTGTEPAADRYLSLGYTVVINCNAESVRKDAQGNKIPNPFMTDLTAYEKLLTPVIQKYAKANVIFAIENEPTNKHMHSGSMSDYLKLLAKGVDIVHKYGGIAIDGAVHVELVNGVDTTDEGSSSAVETLLNGYANIPLDYVNLHTHGEYDSYPANAIPKAVAKIKAITGHPTMSNEWHTQWGTANLMKQMVQQWKDAGVPISIFISGVSDKDDSLIDGTGLSVLGQTYRDVIK